MQVKAACFCENADIPASMKYPLHPLRGCSAYRLNFRSFCRLRQHWNRSFVHTKIFGLYLYAHTACIGMKVTLLILKTRSTFMCPIVPTAQLCIYGSIEYSASAKTYIRQRRRPRTTMQQYCCCCQPTPEHNDDPDNGGTQRRKLQKNTLGCAEIATLRTLEMGI